MRKFVFRDKSMDTQQETHAQTNISCVFVL